MAKTNAYQPESAVGECSVYKNMTQFYSISLSNASSSWQMTLYVK